MTEQFDPNKIGKKKVETIDDPWNPRLEADPDLVTGRLLNNFRFLFPSGVGRLAHLKPELVFKSLTKREITKLRKHDSLCNPQETFRDNDTRIIERGQPKLDSEAIDKQLKGAHSDKKLNTKIIDFYGDIDKATIECGLDPKELEKKLKEAKTSEKKSEFNDLILVVYKKLRKDYGYSHRDLIQ